MRMMGKRILSIAMLATAATLVIASPQRAWSQIFEPTAPSTTPNPLADPTVKPGKMFLFDLEAQFAKDVAARGGAAFADWFAEDGVALGNGAAPQIGRGALAKTA